jgi:hypothetical protein
MLFLNAVAFIYFGIQTSNKSTLIIGAAAASIIVIGWVLKKAWQLHLLALLIVVIGWGLTGYWLLAILIPVLSVFAQITAGNKNIQFNKTTIKLSSPFGRIFNWEELQNIILKDGLLTLDFKNNKLLQTPILNVLNEEETKQFNDFCSKQTNG